MLALPLAHRFDANKKGINSMTFLSMSETGFNPTKMNLIRSLAWKKCYDVFLWCRWNLQNIISLTEVTSYFALAPSPCQLFFLFVIKISEKLAKLSILFIRKIYLYPLFFKAKYLLNCCNNLASKGASFKSWYVDFVIFQVWVKESVGTPLILEVFLYPPRSNI